jgi:hypothetical protein
MIHGQETLDQGSYQEAGFAAQVAGRDEVTENSKELSASRRQEEGQDWAAGQARAHAFQDEERQEALFDSAAYTAAYQTHYQKAEA